MKINSWIVCLLATWLLCMHADEKIFHMIYAENQYADYKLAYYTDPEIKNRDLVYCIKTDNNLYAADVTESKEKAYNGHYELKKIKLYTPKKQMVKNITEIIADGFSQELKCDDLESVKGKLMMIGQPIMYKQNNWIMPAVVKRNYFGFLQSTDLCVIVQKTVKNYGPSDGHFKQKRDDTLKYIVYTIAEGHRTPANFVDIVIIKNDQLMLRSSSKWPTLKTVDLNNPTNKPDKKDDCYFLDSNQRGGFYFDLEAKVSKSFFNKKQVISLTCNVEKERRNPIQSTSLDVKNTYFNFLTKINLNPAFVDHSDALVIQTTFKKFLSNKKLQDPDQRYKVYILEADAALFVPINQDYLSIELLEGEDTTELVDSISHRLHFTSSTYDFTNNRLFYAEYGQESKDVFVRSKTIVLREKPLVKIKY